MSQITPRAGNACLNQEAGSCTQLSHLMEVDKSLQAWGQLVLVLSPQCYNYANSYSPSKIYSYKQLMHQEQGTPLNLDPAFKRIQLGGTKEFCCNLEKRI